MSGGHVVAVAGESTTTTEEKQGGGGGAITRVHVAVVCSAVGFLGFVILILGVAGEAATAQAFVGYSFDGKCQYRATPALACGVVAALLVITAQVVVTATSLCCGCCRTWEVPTETRCIVGIVLSAVSWVTVILVVALFIAGAALNADQERQPDADGDCGLDPGSPLFAAATVLSVAATGMQVASYILLQAAAAATTTPTGSTKPTLETQQPELAMGKPEPQQNAEEVSVDGGQVPAAPSAPVPSQATEPASQV